MTESSHNPPPDEPQTDPVDLDQTDPGRHYFLPVTVSGFVFCVTLLMWCVASIGDPAAPLNQLMNRHGATIIFIETGIVAFLCVLAMTLDRRATLKKQRELADQRKLNSPTATSKAE
ncbi:MAG: hypothetical protein KDA58_10340 [Planctomycetaceae bacterium]|nr:hypothetical protein [Planctomycetaceae bacterium]